MFNAAKFSWFTESAVSSYSRSFTDLLSQDRATILFPALHEVSLNEVCSTLFSVWDPWGKHWCEPPPLIYGIYGAVIERR